MSVTGAPTCVRVVFGGTTYQVEFDAADPDWRSKELAELDPLSDVAFAVRKVPMTRAERGAFDAWTLKQEDACDAR